MIAPSAHCVGAAGMPVSVPEGGVCRPGVAEASPCAPLTLSWGRGCEAAHFVQRSKVCTFSACARDRTAANARADARADARAHGLEPACRRARRRACNGREPACRARRVAWTRRGEVCGARGMLSTCAHDGCRRRARRRAGWRAGRQVRRRHRRGSPRPPRRAPRPPRHADRPQDADEGGAYPFGAADDDGVAHRLGVSMQRRAAHDTAPRRIH